MSDNTLMMGSLTLLGASATVSGVERALTKVGDNLTRSTTTSKASGGLMTCAGALLIFMGSRYMWHRFKKWRTGGSHSVLTALPSPMLPTPHAPAQPAGEPTSEPVPVPETSPTSDMEESMTEEN